jgi:hypothetical protein
MIADLCWNDCVSGKTCVSMETKDKKNPIYLYWCVSFHKEFYWEAMFDRYKVITPKGEPHK